jgi:hypothetical protein
VHHFLHFALRLLSVSRHRRISLTFTFQTQVERRVGPSSAATGGAILTRSQLGAYQSTSDLSVGIADSEQTCARIAIWPDEGCKPAVASARLPLDDATDTGSHR